VEFCHAQLDNGLTMIGEHNPAAQSIACGYFVRTGSRDESSEVLGVSHFLEHMMFKGTERRSADDVNREFDEMGAQYNAFTSEENTVYYGRVLPELQSRLVDLLSDIMRPSLRPLDFDTEKKVILEEIALYEDRPIWVAYDAAREVFRGGHPLGNRVLGTTDSISNLTRDAMLGYFERRYSPSNMLFALMGDFRWDEAVSQVAAATRSWSVRDAPRDVSAPPAGVGVRVVRSDRFQRAHFVWLMPGVSAQDDARYVARVIATAVGDSVGSRFYWALVDPGLVDAASLWHDEEDHAGFFAAYVSCEADKAQDIADIARRVLTDVTQDGLRAEEIERAKQKIASGQVLGAETPMGRLVPVGLAWIYRREYRPLEHSVERLLAVDSAEVEAFLSRRPFDAQALVAVGPFDSLR
jgi:predicted Zn-dependent peptidase